MSLYLFPYDMANVLPNIAANGGSATTVVPLPLLLLLSPGHQMAVALAL